MQQREHLCADRTLCLEHQHSVVYHMTRAGVLSGRGAPYLLVTAPPQLPARPEGALLPARPEGL